MAYPIIPAPYGFKPVSEVGGLPYAGSTRMIPWLHPTKKTWSISRPLN